MCRCLRLAAVGLAAACPSLRCLGAGSGSACSSAPKAAPGGLPSSWGLDKAGGRQGFIAGEDSEPLPPPHLYSAPQGGAGSSGYWSWSRFICKCCVCKRSALTPGAVPAAVPRPRGDLGGRPVPPCAHGDPAVLPLFPWALGKGCCQGLPPPGARPWVEGNWASFEPGSFWGADEIKWVTPPGPTASWLGFPRAAGCRGPEVTRALGSAQETHLITNLLPG